MTDSLSFSSGDDAPRFSHDQVDQIIADRAAIEQATGILMFVYGIEGDHAFELLRSHSRAAQVKVRLFADKIVNDVSALTLRERVDLPSACTKLLLAVHERAKPSAKGS
jgi:hypothetical protein